MSAARADPVNAASVERATTSFFILISPVDKAVDPDLRKFANTWNLELSADYNRFHPKCCVRGNTPSRKRFRLKSLVEAGFWAKSASKPAKSPGAHTKPRGCQPP